MTSRRTVLMALGATAAPLAFSQTPAGDYPNRAIKVVVPFPAGGGGDNLARLVLARLGPELGQSSSLRTSVAPGATWAWPR
jgi:tripartite-type tricarboxylate transporter receptor subunit TctC